MNFANIREQTCHIVDRYGRLIRSYLLKQHGVKRVWSFPGTLNMARLSSPKDPLQGYFLDFSPDADYSGPFDAEGIPLVDYGGLIGIRQNPWAIGHYALANYQRYVETGKEAYRERFLRCAWWFVKCAKHCSRGDIAWTYDFSFRQPSAKSWVSCLAQAYGISVLVIAFTLEGDNRFLQTARGAFQLLTRPIPQGGCAEYDEEGDIIFQEDSSLSIPYVLNGWIFALFGIYDYAVISGEKSAWQFWTDAVRSLQKYLPLYDCGFFSLYNLDRRTRLINPATVFYHTVHILQLETLQHLTGEDIFSIYAIRWRNFLCNPVCRLRAMVHKIIFKALKY
jgi:hypothetical protein